MASAKHKATFISNKLKLLKDQGDDLISSVGLYVSRIITTGDSWTQGGDINMDFQELCQMIESASLFLCEKCEELAGADETQLQKISMAQDRLKAEMEAQAEPDLMESVDENVDASGDRTDEIIDDCRNKHEAIETVTRDLADKVMANSQSFQVLSEGQDDMMTLMNKLETRLQTMGEDRERNVKDVQKQVEKGELNLFLLIQEVAILSRRLQQLEMKSPGTRCGFTAWTCLTGEFDDDTIISQYKGTKCNVGENFNADSGVFTAPVDGLYVAAISLCLWENEHVRVGVQYKQSLDQESGTSVCVCRSSAVTTNTNTCNVGVVDMKAGEVLYSRVYHMVKNEYVKEVFFSCFLLG